VSESDERAATPAGSTPGADPLAAAAELTEALEGMTEALAKVQATVRRGRGVVIALVLVVVVTVVVAFAAVFAQVSSCESGNQTRAADVMLWDHLAAISLKPDTPPAQRAADERLLSFIRRTFAPRNCSIFRLP
jgi:hypothetical protein